MVDSQLISSDVDKMRYIPDCRSATIILYAYSRIVEVIWRFVLTWTSSHSLCLGPQSSEDDCGNSSAHSSAIKFARSTASSGRLKYSNVFCFKHSCEGSSPAEEFEFACAYPAVE